MQRRLIVESIENIRDLGGHPTSSGKQTRWGSFVRADHFQPWSETTRQALVDYGVKLVIDLRAPHELIRMSNSFNDSQQLTYRNMPLLTDAVDLSPRFQNLRMAMTDNHEMYAFMLDECQENIGSILTTIATHNVPTVFHCYAGKDRTGVIAALLLSIAAVDEQAIIDDYALTAEYLLNRIAETRVQYIQLGEDPARFDLLFASTPHTMLTTLKHLQERHGGVLPYLQACGVSEAHVDVLRAMLLEAE